MPEPRFIQKDVAIPEIAPSTDASSQFPRGLKSRMSIHYLHEEVPKNNRLVGWGLRGKIG